MIRPSLAAIVASGAALLSSAVAAQTTGNWEVDFDFDADACYMFQSFDLGGGATSSLSVDLPWEGAPLLIMRNSTWSMAEAATSAEIWFSGDWERAADATVPARFHRADGETHVDVTLSDALLDRMGGTETLTVRVSGGPFERYGMGPTRSAVDDLYDCAFSLF